MSVEPGRDDDVGVVRAARVRVGRPGCSLDRVLPDHVHALLRGQVALGVGREVAGAGVLEVVRHVGAVAVRHPEEALALDLDVERVTRRLRRSARHEVVDRAELDAEANLNRVGAGIVLGLAGRASQLLRELIDERRALCLVADGVDVGQVVGRHVEHRLVCLKAADRGVHAPHHWNIPFLSRPPRRGPAVWANR